MPRVLEKADLLKNVVDASELESFWYDTVRPSGGQTIVNFPESLLGYDIQVVYVPIKKPDNESPVKRRLRDLMARTPKAEGRPYLFSRKDAYDEELA